MAQLVLLVLIVIAALGIRRLLRNAPLARYSATSQALIGLGILLLLVLVLTGRLGVLIPALGAILMALFATVTRLLPLLIPLIVQNLPRWQRYRQQGTGQKGAGTGPAASTVQSRYLRMQLQHATGDLSGEILEGLHKGRTLNQLELPELANLYRLYARNDQESARLLAAYLDRMYGDRWKESAQGNTPDQDHSTLDKAEAYEILGLTSGATREEIISAHRRLIQKLHPDRGGSDYLAAKINQAKDLLLGD
ncbi:MAG: DnaJ domain-containing protein [Methylococcaceae bacterium]|jgi:hypothetical protein|nr:DnaJ domain-containing protein [Methylococcaceae bacterium]